MKAMVLNAITSVGENATPLQLADLPNPIPAGNEVVIRVTACAVCHTELDEIEGRTPPPRLPVVPGHQVVGTIEKVGDACTIFGRGDRVGVAWIFSACGACNFCRAGQENLCENFMATGRDVNGGYAEYMKVSENFAHSIPETFSAGEAAPLLCAGAVGYRALRLTGLEDGQAFGLTGFGASNHLVLKMARHQYPRSKIFVFARSKDERRFARELGAHWAGDTTEPSPEKLHVIIDATPAWRPVVEALKNLRPGGRLVINAIRKEQGDKDSLSRLDYSKHLWLEKEVKSVANVTRGDVSDFLKLASEIPIKPVFEEFALEQANTALLELKSQKIRGAKVLKIA